MIDRKARARLEDIMAAIRDAELAVSGLDLEGYRQNPVVRRAVERCIEVVSEASRHISDELKSTAPDIPWQRIAGIGNVLRHDYQRVDDAMIWNVVKHHLPALKSAVRGYLEADME